MSTQPADHLLIWAAEDQIVCPCGWKSEKGRNPWSQWRDHRQAAIREHERAELSERSDGV